MAAHGDVVWCVIGQNAYEGDELLGVYATEEVAEQAADRARRSRDFDHVKVGAWAVCGALPS